MYCNLLWIWCACYSETPDEINEKLASYYNNLTFNILPPGRFEIIDYQNKKVGLGQGDNGDALNANANLFLQEIKSKPYEFIYSTPDVNEEEIFKDHLEVIKNHNPDFITVIPGRVSVDIARNYYEQMKKEGLNCTFYPIEYDFEKRINEIIKLTQKSEYNVLITGCGEEQAVWDDVKNKLKKWFIKKNKEEKSSISKGDYLHIIFFLIFHLKKISLLFFN